ncbi:hypothetical protein A3A68_02480 [Candidatus Saccharibacteria bacterium RIFCSPLOWO2_01_FULL_48_13]|nr:MAG: hypothetical protein A3A68_02480 [Candidatus Saccharibacteria bacterium RIFCSPLOWO2_01_FULL_48_13]
MNIVLAFLGPVAFIAIGLFMMVKGYLRPGSYAMFCGIGLTVVILIEVEPFAALAFVALLAVVVALGLRREKRSQNR